MKKKIPLHHFNVLGCGMPTPASAQRCPICWSGLIRVNEDSTEGEDLSGDRQQTARNLFLGFSSQLTQLVKIFPTSFLISCSVTLVLATLLLSLLERDPRSKQQHVTTLNGHQEQNLEKTQLRPLKYGGSSCLVSLFAPEIAASFDHPRYRFQYQPHPTKVLCSTPIEPLITTQLTFAYSDRYFSLSERKLARDRNVQLISVPIARDARRAFC